jgi:hypothetical protein
MKLLVVGSVAFDAIETPFGKTDKILGGAATYIGITSSILGVKSGIVSVVGGDFPQEHLDMFTDRGVNIEGIEIVKKLSPILMKHRQMKPNEFVNLDTTTSWFLNESTFIENKEIKSPFYDYKIISKVLTIIFKLVDFINEDYLNEIKYIEQRNMYLEKLLKEKKEELSEFEYIFFSTSVNAKLNSLKIEKEKLMEKFRFFHEVSYTIREYFFALFRIQDSAILTYLPICSLNIFRSSIFFLKEDYQFLEFILKFEEWIPSSYRCIYLLEIIKLFQNKDLDFQIKKSRSKFNPDINLLMLDLMSLYSTLGKNPSVISDFSLFS